MVKQRASSQGQNQEWYIQAANGQTDAFYLNNLWHHYFGTEHIPNRLPAELATIAGWSDEEDSVEAFGVIAIHNPIDRDGSVAVGGGLVTVMSKSETIEQLPDGRFNAEALAQNRNAMLWFGIADPKWRGVGIGEKMFALRLHWAQFQDVKMVFANGWNRRSGRTSTHLFKQYNFTPIQDFPNGYYAHRDACPDCGNWPSNDNHCHCELTLWAKDLENS